MENTILKLRTPGATDSREFFRISVDRDKFDCKIFSKDLSEDALEAEVQDVSPQGISVLFNKPLPISSMVETKIQLPTPYGTIDSQGKIIWVTKQKSDLYRCGIRFGSESNGLGEYVKDNVSEKMSIERRKRQERRSSVGNVVQQRRIRERRGVVVPFEGRRGVRDKNTNRGITRKHELLIFTNKTLRKVLWYLEPCRSTIKSAVYNIGENKSDDNVKVLFHGVGAVPLDLEYFL